MGQQNLTPDQRAMPREVRRQAYIAIPESCHRIRSILNDASAAIMSDLEIPPEDHPALDAALSQVFQRIRDEVSHPFRTEQMRLLSQLITGEPDGTARTVSAVDVGRAEEEV